MEGEMLVDFAKRMEMGVVNRYFKKTEKHRMTYKRGEWKAQLDHILCRWCNEKDWRLQGGDRRECSRTSSNVSMNDDSGDEEEYKGGEYDEMVEDEKENYCEDFIERLK